MFLDDDSDDAAFNGFGGRKRGRLGSLIGRPSPLLCTELAFFISSPFSFDRLASGSVVRILKFVAISVQRNEPPMRRDFCVVLSLLGELGEAVTGFQQYSSVCT